MAGRPDGFDDCGTLEASRSGQVVERETHGLGESPPEAS